MFAWELVDRLLAMKSERVELIVCAISFQDSWVCMRGTQLSARYTVNKYSKPALYDASKCGNVTRR